MTDQRPIPLLGDISLEAVQRIEHSLDGGFVAMRIAGLPGELQQRLARPSHQIQIAGVVFGDGAKDKIASLQKAAENGDELSFAADITTALDLKKVVITRFRAREQAGEPGRYEYELTVVESPPLPPPAQVSPFGGLGDFGLGDLGFDTSLLGDLESVAGAVAGAVDKAMQVIDALQALSNLDGLSLGSGLLKPMEDAMKGVANLADGFKKASSSLASVFGT
jgi:ParB-like chromosome segregation protein Spo0J